MCYLKKLFDLEDEENLILEDYVENILYEEEKCKFLIGKIVQKDGRCIYCGKDDISLNGTYTKNIRLTKLNNKKVMLKVTVQRYSCNCVNCKKNFTPIVSFIDKKKRISKQIHNQISIDMVTPISSKQIARQNHVSVNTVQSNLKKFKNYNIVNKKSLPKVLCVDEFRGVKYYNAKMNFIIVDGEKRVVKDILSNRNKNNIISYFNGYTREARDNVKFFVSDFYDSYIDIAKSLFPKSKIIIDKFHIKRLITVNLKNKRIAIMKRYSKYHFPYRVLKKFRRLLFKEYSKIGTNFEYFRYYEKFYSEQDILNYMLSLDKEFEEMYWVYQDFIEAFNNKDIQSLKEVINREYSGISKDMKTTFKTYKKYQEYIVNAIKYPYSNGLVEGMNNKIKLLKRTGYGYRNFQNFRLRIMIMFNLVHFVEDEKRKESRMRCYYKRVS